MKQNIQWNRGFFKWLNLVGHIHRVVIKQGSTVHTDYKSKQVLHLLVFNLLLSIPNEVSLLWLICFRTRPNKTGENIFAALSTSSLSVPLALSDT